MLKNEKYLKKIIKEASQKILLKEFLGGFLSSDDGDGDFGGFNGNYSSSSYDVKIDDMIIPDTSDPLKKKKNQVIIQSILLLVETDSKYFANFFKQSFKKSEISEEFLNDQEELRENDLSKIEKYIEEWSSDLNNKKFEDKEPAKVYNAANRKLMKYLNDFTPTWPVLWIFLRDARSILRDVMQAFNSDYSSFWDSQDIRGFKIDQLNKEGQTSLQRLLVKKFEKIKLSENDINQIGTEVEGSEEIDEITGYIMTILTFIFGDDIKPVAKELGRAFKESIGTFENLKNTDINVDDKKEKTIERIKDSSLVNKMAQGEATSIQKTDVDNFLNDFN